MLLWEMQDLKNMKALEYLWEDTVAYMHPSALAVLVVMREARAIMQPPFETKSTLNAIKCH